MAKSLEDWLEHASEDVRQLNKGAADAITATNPPARTPAKRATNGHASEHDVQSRVISWSRWKSLETRYADLDRLFAIPNGGQRNKVVAAKMKAEGVKRGVPDLFLPVASCGYYGLFIEMKRQGGRVRKDQQDWLDYLMAAGYLAVVCFSYQETVDTLTRYIDGDVSQRR